MGGAQNAVCKTPKLAYTAHQNGISVQRREHHAAWQMRLCAKNKNLPAGAIPALSACALLCLQHRPSPDWMGRKCPAPAGRIRGTAVDSSVQAVGGFRRTWLSQSSFFAFHISASVVPIVMRHLPILKDFEGPFEGILKDGRLCL
jgi:hypothetical protein